MGYVARLLNEYYPLTNPPTTITDTNEKAAAVQAAIWFFTDRYVLNTSNPTLRPDVVAIVDHIMAEGPLLEPPPPSLTITPSTPAFRPARSVGPVHGDLQCWERHHHRQRDRGGHVVERGGHRSDRQRGDGAVRPSRSG